MTETPQTAAKPALRTLRNSAARHEIPGDFPPAISGDPAAVLALVEAQLEKRGATLPETGRVNLAFPMKHPVHFPGHINTAQYEAVKLLKALMALRPDIEWIKADGIVETIDLDRSGNQRTLHALTARQKYVFYPGHQMQPLPFMQEGNNRQEYFLVVDTCIEQGTTIANMMSMLRENGADILGAVITGNAEPIAQLREENAPAYKLRDTFNSPARNTGQLPALATAFAHSAGRSGMGWSAEECIEMFEEQLNRCGNSLPALTHGECQRIIETVMDRRFDTDLSFAGLIMRLKEHGDTTERQAAYERQFAQRPKP